MPPQAASADVETLRVDGHLLHVRHRLKRLYPSGFSKGEVMAYYARVAPVLLPHLRDRPISFKRFPDGVRGPVFWEKDVPSFAPKWIRTVPVWRRSGESQIHYVVVNDRATLTWLASIAAIELHPFLHCGNGIDAPRSVVFDLDPGAPAGMFECIEVAFRIRKALERVELESWPKVSGSEGLQVYVPLNTPATYAQTQRFARRMAESLATAAPDLVVAEMAKALRAGKVFVDWSQNADFKTTVGVYSLRAKRDRPYVSMPVSWDELRRAAKAGSAGGLFWEPEPALARISERGDLFGPVLTLQQHLPDLAPAAQAPRPRARATRSGSAGTSSRWRRSAQGSTRRFAIVSAGREFLLLLETHGKASSWRLSRLPARLRRVTSRPEGTVAIATLDETATSAWDRGTYQVVDGRVGTASAFEVALTGERVAGTWRFAPGGDSWQVTILDASGRKEARRAASADRRAALAFVAPMLAEQHRSLPRGSEWLYELKLDGYRAQALRDGRRVRLFSRKGNDITDAYPAVADAVSAIPGGDLLLDGEIVALDREGRPSFQALQNRAGRNEPIVYFAFDILHLDGTDLRRQPLELRRETLIQVIRGTSVQLSESLEGDPNDIVAAIKRMKLEGVIAKRRGSHYTSGRSGNWIKVKFLHRQEFVIAGYKPGFGTFESLLAGYYEDGKLRFAGKVRNGFTPRLRADLWRVLQPLETRHYPFVDRPVRAHSHWGEGLTTEDMHKLRWLKPDIVAEVGFVEWTKGGHLRHPAFQGLRSDKAPSEVTRELA
jgi:bifunctional non-homologous end joining protein LigD